MTPPPPVDSCLLLSNWWTAWEHYGTFRKFLKTSRTLLEDVGDWGWSLLFYNLALLPLLPLGFMCGNEMWSASLPLLLPCLSHRDRLYLLLNYKPKERLSSLRCFIVGVFSQCNRKMTYANNILNKCIWNIHTNLYMSCTISIKLQNCILHVFLRRTYKCVCGVCVCPYWLK